MVGPTVTAVATRTLIACGVAAAAALVTGLAAGVTWALAVLAAAFAIMVFAHARNLHRLDAWLRGPVPAPVPAASGAWESVFVALHRFARLRARKESELALALDRFRNAAQALPDGVVALDGTHHIEWNNAAAQGHFGIERQRDAGQPILSLVRQPEFRAYLEAGDYDEPLVLRSGRESEPILSLQLVRYGGDRKLLISRDVSELERVTTVRRDFVANVSHELKTPLTVVAGFLETIEDTDPAPEQLQHYVDLMLAQTRSMQRLIEDLLVLSALENSGNALREERVDVARLLQTVHDEALTLSAGQHRITLAIAPGAVLRGAEAELHSAFGNLMSNAIRYTPAGGSIELGWRIAEGSGVFSVTDSGIGIHSRHIARLTERFYRVDRSRSRATGGTGLGLAIVKHVIMRHQANLDVVSEPGKGSCFSVRFPANRVIVVDPERSAAQ
ncbi:MAG TPA: phosphate regulon sensor histidine kinase PhoR [Burkholderiales bacterium]|nr:phosphate regulon sensor histidine kinase PhoR [Burkholderiales bacterium]